MLTIKKIRRKKKVQSTGISMPNTKTSFAKSKWIEVKEEN
jgi:hypothetical protein